jgi:hypothetical protein
VPKTERSLHDTSRRPKCRSCVIAFPPRIIGASAIPLPAGLLHARLSALSLSALSRESIHASGVWPLASVSAGRRAAALARGRCHMSPFRCSGERCPAAPARVDSDHSSHCTRSHTGWRADPEVWPRAGRHIWTHGPYGPGSLFAPRLPPGHPCPSSRAGSVVPHTDTHAHQ